MIKDIFPSPPMAARLQAGHLGSYMDLLATALQIQGYSTSTISAHLREVHAFGCWLAETYKSDEIREQTLERYLDALSSQKQPLSTQRRQRITAAIRLLVKHLRQAGVIAMPLAESLPETEVRQWLIRYQQYLGKVLGLAPETSRRYLITAVRLFEAMSQDGVIDWSNFTADKLTAFLQADVMRRKGNGPHGTATAVRSCLRFLVAQGQISAGLEIAIPPIRRWSQGSLPQRLSTAEISQLLTFCSDQTVTGKRNYAMLLLLSRLGLRAKEVAGLQLNDIDWTGGSLLVRSSKTHCQRLLPLPQDVGEALLSYLQNGRPETTAREVFLTTLPPYRPLETSSTISVTVKRILARAGIKHQSPSGAHLLRHSAATQMVNRGASFKDVADILGHQQLQTTGVYAKLDLAALEKVALPWPGGAQ